MGHLLIDKAEISRLRKSGKGDVKVEGSETFSNVAPKDGEKGSGTTLIHSFHVSFV